MTDMDELRRRAARHRVNQDIRSASGGGTFTWKADQVLVSAPLLKEGVQPNAAYMSDDGTVIFTSQKLE